MTGFDIYSFSALSLIIDNVNDSWSLDVMNFYDFDDIDRSLLCLGRMKGEWKLDLLWFHVL